MHVFICENTPNGILTGVYDAWELKIQERCSHADIYLYRASRIIDLSGKKKMDKANAVYQTIVAALHSPKGARVLDSLSNPYIYRVFELSRATASEAHHLKGFLRFS